VKKKGLCSGAGKSRHDFSADQPRFPDPRNNDPTLAIIDQFNRTGKRFPDSVNQSEDALSFDPKHLFGLLYGNIFVQLHVLSEKKPFIDGRLSEILTTDKNDFDETGQKAS
jgi:hypothetical protein